MSDPLPNLDVLNMIEQFCRDLNAAHNEILKLQGVNPEDFDKYDWPEWSAPANSIRWAERLLQKRLAKTPLWSEVPALCRCPPAVCLLHSGQATCGMRERTPIDSASEKTDV